MAGKYYVEGAARAERVGDLFAVVAPRYDLINDLQSFGLHRRWKRRLVALAGIQPGERALDVCCGTGDVAFALARAGAEVTGLDFSEAMLAVARRRRIALSPPCLPPDFIQGDALDLPFPDAGFDVVTMSYGLRNLSDFMGGLSELRRVLRPGGRLVVLDFGKPDHPVWRGLYFLYLRWLVPVFGRCLCGDADTYSYILDSLRKYPGPRGVAAAVQQLGFTETRLVNLLGGIMGINQARKPEAQTDPARPDPI